MIRQSSIRSVNLLYLVIMLLMVASLALTFIPHYTRLVLTQAVLILLPASLFLRFVEKQDLRTVAERVRWRWPGWKVGLLGLLIGIGLYPVSIAIAGIFQQLMGYTDFIDPDLVIPSTVPTAIMAVLAYAVMAPLCEEILFRGVIQPVYERRGAAWAVLFVGFLFIAFHLSLLQGLSIVLITLALGYVFLRTRSLQASILTHFGANGMAALVITGGVFNTGAQSFLLSPAAMIAGPLVALVALVGLILFTRRTEEADPPAAPTEPVTEPVVDVQTDAPRRRGWVWTFWPLVVAGLFIWLPLVSLEFFIARQPELLAQFGMVQPTEPVKVGAAPWQDKQAWQYEIRNIVGDVVGEGVCELAVNAVTIEITCASDVKAYQVEYGGGTFMSSGGERIDRVAWNRADGELTSGTTTMDLEEGAFQSDLSWSVSPGGISITYQDTFEVNEDIFLALDKTPLARNPDLMLAHSKSWPWQLAAMQFGEGQTGSVIRFDPYTWRSTTRDQGPVAETRNLTVTEEEVQTPAGTVAAWKVITHKDEAAWFDLDGGVKVVQFFNGIETWVLK
jgi:membrane protease YdiL (CAAX protease family)